MNKLTNNGRDIKCIGCKTPLTIEMQEDLCCTIFRCGCGVPNYVEEFEVVNK